MGTERLMAYSFSDSLQTLSDQVAEWIPRLIGALLILLIGYIIAKVLAGLVRRLLKRVDLDGFLERSPVTKAIVEKIPDVSTTAVLVGLTFWLIFLAALGESARALDVESINSAVATIWGYIPNVLAALLIVVVAVIVAGFVRDFLRKVMGDTPLGTIASVAAPVLILVVAGFMTLVQLRIAVPIVTGTYYIILGAIAAGSAIAFGLGGRDAAKRLLDEAVEKGRSDS
ncbi:MAG: hypothetical protein OEM67_06980 [Thermoleophilia bacterium]|nr:hypothetical protein [Thermoleophilia bacterium]MDH3725279.1 hypothetical protein [Thermoleophilia bacterium]